MSDFWSFYEFDQLMREGAAADRLAKGFRPKFPTTAGQTEKKPDSAVSGLQSLMGVPVKQEKKPAPVAAASEPEVQSPARIAKKPTEMPAARIGGEDPLANLPRAAKAVAKGQEHKIVKDMPDSEAKAELIARIRQGRTIHDKVMGYNDVNGNWLTGYWVMIDTLKKLGYEVPEIPMDAHPRWVPTRDGGFVRGNYEENGGSPDGPYVTINQNSNPYSVTVEDPRELKRILKAAIAVTRAGGDIESESPDKNAWLASRAGTDKGLSDIDTQAGTEGESMQDAMLSVGKRRQGGKSLSRQDQADAEQFGKIRSKVRTTGFRPKEGEKKQQEWNQMVEWLQYSDLMLEHAF